MQGTLSRPATAITPDGAAVILAAILNVDPRPLVQVLELVTGQPVARLEVKDHGGGELTMPENVGELDALDVPEGTPARWRTGQLITSTGMTAADVSLIWVPTRLPAQARALIDQGQRPAGAILGPHGATRHWSRARAQTGAGVKSQAVVYLDGLPVALAAEDITLELCELMAANWTRLHSAAGGSRS